MGSLEFISLSYNWTDKPLLQIKTKNEENINLIFFLLIFLHLDNLDYLHDLLTQFESPDLNKCIKVPNWSNQGQIFLDFIDINEKVSSKISNLFIKFNIYNFFY